MVESYLKAPVALKPFSTIEVFIPTTDVRGGTGANFVVDWAATGEIAEPVVEALMVGGVGSGHYAFISPGPADEDGRQELEPAASNGPWISGSLNKNKTGTTSMTSSPSISRPCCRQGCRAPAASWTGLAKYSFVGGNNDPEQVPVDGLIEAVNAVLQARGQDARDLWPRQRPAGLPARCANSLPQS